MADKTETFDEAVERTTRQHSALPGAPAERVPAAEAVARVWIGERIFLLLSGVPSAGLYLSNERTIGFGKQVEIAGPATAFAGLLLDVAAVAQRESLPASDRKAAARALPRIAGQLLAQGFAVEEQADGSFTVEA